MKETRFALAFLILGIGLILYGLFGAKYREPSIVAGVLFLAVAAIRNSRADR